MSDNPNTLIEKRLKNIENRIARLAFLHAHLKKFKEDKDKIDDSSRTIEGVSLFYYYSFSQFILEINKLFDNDTREYYTIPKLLNHIESNIKHVGWYKSKETYPEPTKDQYESGKAIWSSGKRTEWQEPATGTELNEKQRMVRDLKSRIIENQEDLDKIKLARDKVIAHLDKKFQKHNFRIELEMVEKLLLLAHEIFNTLNQELKGTILYIEHIASDTLSTLLPITKFYQLRSHLISTRLTHEKTIELEELNKIIK